jgi:hypothetical protein
MSASGLPYFLEPIRGYRYLMLRVFFPCVLKVFSVGRSVGVYGDAVGTDASSWISMDVSMPSVSATWAESDGVCNNLITGAARHPLL